MDHADESFHDIDETTRGVAGHPRREEFYRARFEEGLSWNQMRERFDLDWRSTHFLSAMAPYIAEAGLQDQHPDLSPITGDTDDIARQIHAARERGQGWAPLAARTRLSVSEVKNLYMATGGKTLRRLRYDLRYKPD